MAKPRIFVSSTYYDLKHLRSALTSFIESLGFEAIISERGSIPYAPDAPLDISCYREAKLADIMVIIVGGRYGSERTPRTAEADRTFFSEYDSITREEFRNAVEANVPIYVAIESGLYAEHRTYLKNATSTDIKYAHVDSVNIFKMIDEIQNLPLNNPIFPFEHYHNLETWLRDQWSGLFRELLARVSNQKQIATISEEVAQLRQQNQTLKNYLEELVRKASPDESNNIIGRESNRLVWDDNFENLISNPLIRHLKSKEVRVQDAVVAMRSSNNLVQFFNELLSKYDNPRLATAVRILMHHRSQGVLDDANNVRKLLDLPPFTWGDVSDEGDEAPASTDAN
jgi:Domain of unknown function (DUF4062)